MIATFLLSALAMPQDADALLAKIRESYSHVTTAQYKVQFKTADPNGRRLKGSADVWLLRPKSIRVVVQGLSDGERTIVSDGISILTRRKAGSHVSAFSLDSISHLLPLNVETFAFLDPTKELSTEKGGGMNGSSLSVMTHVWNEHTWTVLEELNKTEDTLDRYYIGKEDHLIWRVTDLSADGRTEFGDYQVLNLKTGEPISESMFHVTKQ